MEAPLVPTTVLSRLILEISLDQDHKTISHKLL